jgi:hypothetical protein
MDEFLILLELELDIQDKIIIIISKVQIIKLRQKNILALKNDFNSFKKSPEKFSVVEKKTMTETFEDYKLELIKSLRKFFKIFQNYLI